MATAAMAADLALKLDTGWRSLLDLSIARSRKIRGGNYVQLATVENGSGLPRVRTVVQRGFHAHNDDHPSVFKFITDRRSQKVGQIQALPRGELVWWFLKSNEQYRVSGNITLVGEQEADPVLRALRLQMWGNLRDPAREQFYGATPGVPLNEDPEGGCTDNTAVAAAAPVIPKGGRGSDGKVLRPPLEFLTMLLWPEKVDYLRLTDNLHLVFSRNGQQWSRTRVTP